MKKSTVLSLIFFFILFTKLLAQSPQLDWAKQLGGTGYQGGNSIDIDSFGNIYTTGGFSGTVDFDPGVGVSSLTSNGQNDIFIQKLDSSGNFLWARQIGSGQNDHGNSINIGSNGEIFITGTFSHTVDFHPGSTMVNLTSYGNSDIFILKYDLNGNFIWVKQLRGIGNNRSTEITSDANGNSYLTGVFETSLNFNTGQGTAIDTSAGLFDTFICKLDPSGDLVWVNTIGGPDNEYSNSISIDSFGNLYTLGYFYNTIDFNPNSGPNNLTSAGGKDVFILKHDSNGHFIWAKNYGGTNDDEGFQTTIDHSGNIISTGNFSGNADFDPGLGSSILTSNRQKDVYIQKLDANGNFLWAKHVGGFYSDYGYSIKTDKYGNTYATGSFAGTVDFDPGIGVYNLTPLGGGEIFILKLNQNGDFVWAINLGGYGLDVGSSIAIDKKGGIYNTGSFEGVAEFDPSSNSFNLNSLGGNDAYILKLGQPNFQTKIITYSNQKKFKAYPNPTSGFITLKFEEFQKDLIIKLYSISGQLLRTENYKKTQLLNYQINQPKGMYFLNISDKSGKQTVLKMVKE